MIVYHASYCIIERPDISFSRVFVDWRMWMCNDYILIILALQLKDANTLEPTARKRM